MIAAKVMLGVLVGGLLFAGIVCTPEAKIPAAARVVLVVVQVAALMAWAIGWATGWT